MIIGTAGHIDHGKTTLVRALTGVDTDRLKEEKARGISIELGYAYLPSREGRVLGFIDVPGHERFVHTMVAGACGIDVALLVVAADDGVMPQTREHLAILELLGITEGVVALTKIDRVSAARREEVRAELATLLGATPFRGAPAFFVDATAPDDPGARSLRVHLEELASKLAPRRAQQLFRMPIDRVFSLPGHGTIVAGTVFSGVIREGDTFELMPARKRARVRTLHAQNRPAQSAEVGERCAVNLAGIDKRAVARGDWLAAPALLEPTTRLDVRLRLLPAPGIHLAPWAPLHVHLGTSRCIAHPVFLETTGLSSGEDARVQLVFSSPVCARTGDPFIVRNAQATHTVGGGTVLDCSPPARRRRTAQRLRNLAALEEFIATSNLAPLLRESPHGIATAELVRLTGLPGERLELPQDALRVDTPAKVFVILPEYWHALTVRAIEALGDFHRQFPEELGPDVGRLRRMAAPELAPALWEALIERLRQEQRLRRTGAWLHLPDHAARLSESDLALTEKLRPLIVAGRFDPPWVRELAATVHEPEERVRAVLRKQLTFGVVYQVVHDLFYDAECVAELAAIARLHLEQDGTLSAARYRDALGLGRKRTVQILEFFDRVGFTRRIRDSHVLRRDTGWGGTWKAHAPGGAAGLQTQEGAADASW